METRIKNLGTIAFVVAFSFITIVASANDIKADTPRAELKYIGNVQNQPVFRLDLSSAKEEYYTISIKDQFGEVLYTEKVKAKNFTRNFRLDTETLSDVAVLKVEVKDSNKNSEVFTINRNARFVEETSVTRL